MNYIIHKLAKDKSKVKNALLLTGTIIYTFINILMVFLLGIKNLTNETLDNDDLTQFITIISSMILVIFICLFFLQRVISIEIRTLFESRRIFNTNIRLMGVSSKQLKNIYFSELRILQKKVILIGLPFSYFSTTIISKFTDIPNTNLPILIVSLCIYIIMFFISSNYILNILIKINVIDNIRNNAPSKKNIIFNKIKDVTGCILFFIFIIAKFKDSEWADLLFLISLILLNNKIIYYMNKTILRLSEKLRIPSLQVAVRLLLNNYKTIKNSIFLLSFGIMLFLGLQIIFNTTRYHTKQVGENNLLFSQVVSEVGTDQNDNNITTFEDKFILEKDGKEKHIKGIDSNYIKAEKISFDKKLSHFSSFSDFDNDTWNGIVVPNGYINKDNIGEKIILKYNNEKIEFTIVGGYYQNTFQHNTWLVSKKFLKRQLKIEYDYTNKYLLNNEKVTYNSKSKQDIILESVDKVTSSTEPVLITSIIVIIVAIFNILNFFILQSNEDTLNITRLRSIGLTIPQVKKIYKIQIYLIILESFLLGYITAVLFAKISLNSLLIFMNVEMLLQIPVKMLFFTFIFIILMLIISFMKINKNAFHSQFINLTRYNTF